MQGWGMGSSQRAVTKPKFCYQLGVSPWASHFTSFDISFRSMKKDDLWDHFQYLKDFQRITLIRSSCCYPKNERLIAPGGFLLHSWPCLPQSPRGIQVEKHLPTLRSNTLEMVV